MASAGQSPVHVPFNRGLREDVATQLAPPGSFARLENVEYEDGPRIVKRLGFRRHATDAIAKFATFAGPVRRFALYGDEERILCTDDQLFTVGTDSDATGSTGTAQLGPGIATEWPNAQRLSLLGHRTFGGDPNASVRYVDAGAYGEYVITLTHQKDDVAATWSSRVDVASVATGARIMSAWEVYTNAASTSILPRVVVASNYVHFLHEGAANQISCYTIKFETDGRLTLVGATTIINDADAAGLQFFDAATTYGGFVIMYRIAAGGIRLRRFDATGTPTDVTTWTPAGITDVRAVAVCGATTTGERIYGMVFDNGGLQMVCATWDYNLASKTADGGDATTTATACPQQIAICRVNSTTAFGILSGNANATATRPAGHIDCYSFTSAGASTKYSPIYNVAMASKPWADTAGKVYFVTRFYDPSAAQSGYVVVHFPLSGTIGGIPTRQPQMMLASGRVGGTGASGGGGVASLSNPAVFSDAAVWCAPLNTAVPANPTTLTGLWVLLARGGDRFMPCRLGDVHLFAGGTPLLYDGQRVSDLGFYWYPPVGSGDAAPNAAGGSMPQGIFRYRFVYEWIDATGRRHQSFPSPEIQVDMSAGGYAAGTNRVVWTLPTLTLTRKVAAYNFSPVRILCYRSIAGGSELFLCSKTALNSVTAATVSFTDTRTDTGLNSNEKLYYPDLGQLGHGPIPPTTVLVTYGERLAGIDQEDPTKIWFSKTLTQGNAPQHHESLRKFVPGIGVAYALAALDGKLYIFGEKGIWVLYGEGFDNAGGGQSWSEPYQISGEHSITDPRGVLVGPDGVYFVGKGKTSVSVFLLRRGDAVIQEVGRGVRDTLASYPTPRGAIYRRDKARIEFAMGDSGHTAARILYYHLDVTDEHGVGLWTNNGFRGSDAIESIGYLDGTTWLGDTENNYVYSQSGSSYKDDVDGVAANAVAPTYALETHDFRPFGMQGSGKVNAVQLFGVLLTDTKLTLEVSFNSGRTWQSGTKTFTPTTAVLGVNSPLHLFWEHDNQAQKRACTRYRITLSEEAVGGEGGYNYALASANLALLGLSLEGVPTPGLTRSPSVQEGA